MSNPTLQVIRKSKNAEVVPMRAGLTIGRSPQSGIQVEDSMISRTHAELLLEGDTFVLRDRSANGTTHNGKRLAPGDKVPLRDGDRIGFAHYADCEIHVQLGVKAAVPQRPQAPQPEPAPKPPTPTPQPLPGVNIPVWSKGQTDLRVADIIDEAPGVRTYRFVGLTPQIFSYKPGQFVTLFLEIDGKKVARSYSLSSTPSRPHVLEITVKRVPGGLVSNWLADNLKLGDRVRIGSPAGKFTCFDYPSDKMLFIGAGSGVTPLMSMTRWVIDTIADVDIRFLLAARTPDDIIFHRELEYLSARHSGFQCAVTITRLKGGSDPWLGYTGHISRAMLDLVAPDLKDRHVFLCGPPQFADAVRQLLTDIGFPISQFHTESFVPGRVGPEVKQAPRDVAPGTSTIERVKAEAAPVHVPVQAPAHASAPAPKEQPAPEPAGQFTVKFAKAGISVKTTGEASLLELAENNGIEIPYQCRSGGCGECRVRCLSGKVEMMTDDGLQVLDPGERSKYVLTCVGTPRSNVEIMEG